MRLLYRFPPPLLPNPQRPRQRSLLAIKDRVSGLPVISLPLSPGTTGGVGFVATTISDDGHTIGGQANSTNGDVVPVRWLCH